MPTEIGAQGIPLGVATALLELDISQIVKGERAVAATIQNIAKAQEMLLRGDQALQTSAKVTLGILQQQQRVTRGQQGSGNETRQRAQAVQQEAQQAQELIKIENSRLLTMQKEVAILAGFMASLSRIQLEEAKRIKTAGTLNKAKQQEVEQTRKVLTLTERIAAANEAYYKRLQQNVALERGSFTGGENIGIGAFPGRTRREDPGSFVGQLRNAPGFGSIPFSLADLRAAGGGAGAGGGRGGGGGFGAGNPNIPTFAQFGLFPFAGLAGAAGAPGLQQGILGASSALGIAELGSFRNATVRLANQLQGLGGIFGSLATTGAQAAQALGAKSGGFISSLASIGLAITPLLAGMAGLVAVFALLNKVTEDTQKQIDANTNAILGLADAAAQGTTSEEARQTEQERTARLQVLRPQFAQLLALTSDLTTGQAGLITPGIGARTREATLGQQQAPNLLDLLGLGAIQGTLNNVSKEIDQLESAGAGAAAAQETGVIAANDAAAAAEAATAANQAWAQSLLDAQIKAREAASQLSSAQLGERIEELQTQFTQMTRIMQDPTSTFQFLSEEAKQQFNERAALLQVEIDIYKQARTPLHDFILALKGLPDFLKNLRERSAAFGQAQARQTEDEARADARQQEDQNRQRLRALEDFGRETQQAEEQYQTQRQRVIDDAARADVDLVEEAAGRRQDLIDEANQKELEAEEEHQSRIAKILREGRTRILEAAARLDARGVLETQRRMKDQLAEEDEQRTKAREDAQEKLAEQLADLDENLEEQRRRRAEDLQRRLQDMATEFTVSQQRRRDDFFRRLQQEDQERAFQAQRETQDRALRRQRQLDDFARETNDQLQHYTNLAQIQQNGLEFLRQGFQNFFTQAAQTLPYANAPYLPFGGIGGIGTGYYGGGGSGAGGGGAIIPVRTFAQGINRVPQDMLAGLHAGERVLTPLQNAMYERGGGQVGIVVNINGDIGNNSLPQVRDAAQSGAEAAFNEYMRKMAMQGMAMLSKGGKR